MKNKNKIIENLSKELATKKSTRINIRMTNDLHRKLVEHKEKTGVCISDIIRISLLNYFENEVND
jgi:hypothetical protein